MTPGALRRPSGMQARRADATVVVRRGNTELLSWPLLLSGPPDVAVTDDLARLALAARRLDCDLCLRNVSADLSELLELVGLGAMMAERP